MNRYKIGLTVSTVLFVIIAIFSSMVGVGLLQGFLILAASILLLGMFIGGTVVFGWEKFWWEHFKPAAAVPIAWGLFHLVFVFMLPDISAKLWALHWKIIIVIELCAFVTCWILNKKEPFEKRVSRKFLMAKYVYLFITVLLVFGCRLFFGEFTANLNREMLYRLVSSEVELTAENIEKFDKKHKSKPLLAELDRLTEEGKKRSLSKLELARVEGLTEAVKKEYAVPEERKIDWQKLWSFGKPAQARGPERRLSGIFKLPADGRIVSQDTKGRELWYHKGEYVRFEQLNSPGKFTIINQKSSHPTWTTGRKTVTSSRTKYGDKIQLRAVKGKEVMVQAKIIPRRS